MRKKFKYVAAFMVSAMLMGSFLNTKTVFATEANPDLATYLAENTLQKPLEQGMIVKEKALDENGAVSCVEFMSMLNNAMGVFHEETYKGLDNPSDPWYEYVIRTAESVGYAHEFDHFVKEPEAPITKYEAAQIIARIKKMNVYDVIDQGILDARDDNQVKRKDMARIFDSVKSDNTGNANVARVDAVGNKTILVTFDSYIDNLDVGDIGLYGAKGKWSKPFDADISSEISVNKVSVGINKLGNTVLIYDINSPLETGATLKVSEPEDYTTYYKDFDKYLTGDLSKDRVFAENVVSWQMDHGGWGKNIEKKFVNKWDGVEKKSSTINLENGVELGTTDNNATIMEIVFLADMYNKTNDQAFKESVQKGIQFLINMQYPSGGFPQMYPSRTSDQNSTIYYSNFATYNDDAMGRVLKCFDKIINKEAPFNTDIVDQATIKKLQTSYDKGIDYILKSQIKVNGKLTVWCAQHDPVTYEPRQGRAYEHESLSGSESVPIVQLLMSTPNQTPEVRAAIKGALEWFDTVKEEGVRYDRKNAPYFMPDPNSTIWYRFYEIGTNKPIFSGRDGFIKYDLMQVEKERREGYSWATTLPASLLEMAKTTGYYKDKVFVKVMNTNSKNKAGLSLKKDALTVVNDKMN